MYQWNIKSKYKNDKPLVDQILLNRDIKDIDTFLNPPSISTYFSNFSGDFKKSLLLSKKIILKCISKNIPIVIYGDYDSDGVNATAIIYSTIKDELKYDNISYFIPNRFTHGYGLSKNAIDEILLDYKDKKVLFITVDTGITGLEEAEYIKSLGHYLIITDHHQKSDVIPKCDALVWNEDVVGSMVSWLLSKALGSKNKYSLGLVAIATVTDLFPLLEINRSIVNSGLKILNYKLPLGLKHLLSLAKRDKNITTYELGWVIGPRLNAAGRMKDAGIAVELLLESGNDKSLEIAQEIHKINTTRQNKTNEMYTLSSVDEVNLPHVIVEYSDQFHDGLIGLVASKFVQKYYRPSLVISTEGEIGKGSARSINGINIIETLRQFRDLFIDLGGHPMAAGFSIKKENISILQKQLNDYVKNNHSKDTFLPILNIDIEIPLDIVNLDTYDSLIKLEPFGNSNSEPVFCSNEVTILDLSLVGKNKDHVSFKLSFNNLTFKAIWFGAKDEVKDIAIGDSISLVYTLNKNTFNNYTTIDLMVKDVKLVAN